MPELDVNTTTTYPTHFLRAVELISKARNDYEIPSENWPSPTEYHYGMPDDQYYCEVWVDGMDWQASYWILEKIKTNTPIIRPLMVFEQDSDRAKIHNRTFRDMLNAFFWYRRDNVWIKQDGISYFSDMVWPYISPVETVEIYGKILRKYYIGHASQKRVEFWLNEAFVPPRYRWRPKNERANENFGSLIPTGPADHTLNNEDLIPDDNSTKP